MTYSKQLTGKHVHKNTKMGQETDKAAQTAESWCTFCMLDNCLFLTPLFVVVDIVTYTKKPLMCIKKLFGRTQILQPNLN